MNILLAVSGGPDSMCLADKMKYGVGDSIAVAHCNFHLRGQESDGDMALVQKWCSDNGIKCYVKDFDTLSYAKENGISIEMAAREQRYGWFAALCREEGFDAVAVAHNADDNVETLMLNLLRGTGAKGLRGMKPESVVPGNPDIPLLRPLLSVSRNEIEEYNRKNGVPFRIDSTNLETDAKRNKIRNLVMPVFRQINPSCLQTLSNDMGIFAQLADIAEDFYKSRKHALLLPVASDNELRRINVPALMGEKHWKYLLYRLCEPFSFSMGDLDAIAHLLQGNGTFSGKEFNSPSYRLVTAKDTIIIANPKAQPSEKIEGFKVEAPGLYEVGDSRILVTVQPFTEDMPLKQPAGILMADSAQLTFPFVIRKWKEGDWMCPLGLGGKRKKLSDVFTDLKLSKIDKEGILVIQIPGQEKTAAIVGLRIDDSVKVTDATSNIVLISLI